MSALHEDRLIHTSHENSTQPDNACSWLIALRRPGREDGWVYVNPRSSLWYWVGKSLCLRRGTSDQQRWVPQALA